MKHLGFPRERRRRRKFESFEGAVAILEVAGGDLAENEGVQGNFAVFEQSRQCGRPPN